MDDKRLQEIRKRAGEALNGYSAPTSVTYGKDVSELLAERNKLLVRITELESSQPKGRTKTQLPNEVRK